VYIFSAHAHTHTHTHAHAHTRTHTHTHAHAHAHRKRERSVFLARQLQALKPFITEKVIKTLESVALESPRKTRAGAVASDSGASAAVNVSAAADEDGDDDEITLPGCKISDTQLQDLLHECELRDYQCDGIRFLIEMYDRGIPAILGDEVGCVVCVLLNA
jgi:SNF2 family DNA or RNA helicase